MHLFDTCSISSKEKNVHGEYKFYQNTKLRLILFCPKFTHDNLPASPFLPKIAIT